MEIAEIVLRLLDNKAHKQEELASRLGTTQATVSRWTKGSEPRGNMRDKILELARDKGIIVDRAAARSKIASPGRFAAVPLLSWVSAGKLADANADIPDDDTQMISVADLGQGQFFALRVSGTSMDRLSPDKSVIVVNRAERSLQEGKPYVFAVRGEATYKLWRATPPRLEPFSTDPSNQPIFIDKRNKLYVVGRVRRSILDL